MRALLAGIVSVAYLYGAPGDTQSVLNEVSKLRSKYEECRQSREGDEAAKIQGYQKRISALESQLKEASAELGRLRKKEQELSEELSRKKGVIQSLEKTLTSRDAQYREAASRNERLEREANGVRVGKIERENLTKALAKAKEEIARLQKEMAKAAPGGGKKELESARTEIAKLKTELAAARSTGASPSEPAKLKGLQEELAAARAEISLLKSAKPSVKVEEKIVERVVYRDRPVEKVVTKTVEPTEKINALQNELAFARSTIERLKKAPPPKEKIVEKVVYRDRPIEKAVEKVVYKDRVVTEEKIVYKEKPVEKIVYKDRPVIQEKVVEKVVYRDRPIEKVVTKTVEPTEKINALQAKLASAEAQISKLKNDLASSQSKRSVAAAVPAQAKRVSANIAPAEAAKKPAVPASSPLQKKSAGASAYRMAVEAPIYSAPGGTVIDRWEARRSFTAGSPSGGWVRITGYFVNRVWQPAGENENLWVRESDVIRR